MRTLLTDQSPKAYPQTGRRETTRSRTRQRQDKSRMVGGEREQMCRRAGDEEGIGACAARRGACVTTVVSSVLEGSDADGGSCTRLGYQSRTGGEKQRAGAYVLDGTAAITRYLLRVPNRISGPVRIEGWGGYVRQRQTGGQSRAQTTDTMKAAARAPGEKRLMLATLIIVARTNTGNPGATNEGRSVGVKTGWRTPWQREGDTRARSHVQQTGVWTGEKRNAKLRSQTGEGGDGAWRAILERRSQRGETTAARGQRHNRRLQCLY